MRVYFITPIGVAVVERLHQKFRLVEFLDGFHPITNDAIWSDGSGEGYVFIWQGRSSPEGQGDAKVRFSMKVTNRLKDVRDPIVASRRWLRIFRRGVKFGIIATAVIFVIYFSWRIGGIFL